MRIDTCGSRVRVAASDNGWPGRPISSVRFEDLDGHYIIRFEDGAEAAGIVRAH